MIKSFKAYSLRILVLLMFFLLVLDSFILLVALGRTIENVIVN